MYLHPAQPVENIPGNYSGQVEATKVLTVAMTGGVNEVQTVTCASFAGSAQGDYCVFSNAAGNTFAVWLDKDANGTTPTGAAYVAATNKIKASISTGGTNAQTASAIKTAIEANSNYLASNITASLASNVLTLTHSRPGDVTAPAVHNTGDTGAGSLAVATSTGGASPSLNSKYFICSSNSTNYYVWFNVNHKGSDPSVASKTAIPVALTGNESITGIASAAATEINAISGLTASYDSDGNIIISNDSKANVLNAGAGDSGFSVVIKAQGEQSRFAPDTSVGGISVNPSVISALT